MRALVGDGAEAVTEMETEWEAGACAVRALVRDGDEAVTETESEMENEAVAETVLSRPSQRALPPPPLPPHSACRSFAEFNFSLVDLLLTFASAFEN